MLNQMKFKLNFFIFILTLALLKITHGFAAQPVMPISDFYVEPTRIVITNIHKASQLNIHNQAPEPQTIQSTLSTMAQYTNKENFLAESNSEITTDPQVIITPLVSEIKPKSSKILKILALRQMESTELAYRLFVKSIPRLNLTGSGTTIDVAFGIPLYILPKHIIENASYKIIKDKHNQDKYFLKISNTGNVHLNINSIDILDEKNKVLATVTPAGVILSGKTNIIPFKLNKHYNAQASFKANIKMQNLINYNTVSVKSTKIQVEQDSK